MTLTAGNFYSAASHVVAMLEPRGLKDKIYSDVIDAAGNQYVDLVMEGGGVLGIALAGYVYILEQVQLRFVGIGGASAGSIAALILGASGPPSQSKSGRLMEILANVPMASFMDGKDDDDEDAADFVNTMLSEPSFLKGMAKGLQVVDNLKEIKGLNRGEKFHQWLKSVLEKQGITSTAELRARMATTPEGWTLRPNPHQTSQLDGNASLPPLDPLKHHLCLVAADISTETKVEFPRMAELYWQIPDAVHPADYVRASMSIPVFFSPYRVPLPAPNKDHWKEHAGLDSAKNPRFPPKQACFVDGGVMSNFPIDVFHSTHKVPSRPTFGVKLEYDERSHEISNVLELIGQTFNASRHCLDYEFIRKNPDFQQLVGYIDTKEHHWLKFEMAEKEMTDLFVLGAEAALDFLTKFDWGAYKNTRAHLIGAYRIDDEHKKQTKNIDQ
jgi:NTE family protein